MHPDRPQRLAVAAALRELADLWEAAGTGGGRGLVRHRATAAVLQAYRTLGVQPPTGAERDGRGDTCLRLTDLAWVLLIVGARRAPDDPHGPARSLRRQAGILVGRRRLPRMLPEPAALSRTVCSLTAPSPAGPDPAAPAGLRAAEARAAELVTGRGHGSAARTAVLTVPALRMFLGTGLAGAAALPLGLGHGYWAAISAAAVLHSVNVRTAAQRAAQRTLGTMAGLLLALGILAARPEPVVLVVVIVVMEFLLEYVVARNYGLGVVFLTPLALLLTDLTAPSPAGTSSRTGR